MAKTEKGVAPSKRTWTLPSTEDTPANPPVAIKPVGALQVMLTGRCVTLMHDLMGATPYSTIELHSLVDDEHDEPGILLGEEGINAREDLSFKHWLKHTRPFKNKTTTAPPIFF